MWHALYWKYYSAPKKVFLEVRFESWQSIKSHSTSNMVHIIWPFDLESKMI